MNYNMTQEQSDAIKKCEEVLRAHFQMAMIGVVYLPDGSSSSNIYVNTNAPSPAQEVNLARNILYQVVAQQSLPGPAVCGKCSFKLTVL